MSGRARTAGGWVLLVFVVCSGGVGVLAAGVNGWLDGIPERGRLVIFGSVVGLLAGWAGAVAARVARRGRQELVGVEGAARILEAGPFVLYLRGFDRDAEAAQLPRGIITPGSRTEEEQIVAVARRVAPVVAVQRPGEERPPGGALRLVLPAGEWQPWVARLIGAAQLVILVAGPGAGLAWEVERAAAHLPRERLVLLFAGGSGGYQAFRGGFGHLFRPPLPFYPTGRRRKQARKSNWWLRAVVRFDAAGRPTVVPFDVGGWLAIGARPTALLLGQALRPVLASAGARPPGFRWGKRVVVGTVAFCTLAGIALLGVFDVVLVVLD